MCRIRVFFTVVFVLLLSLPAVSQDLPLEAAEEIVAAAKKKAVELNTRMDIAVVDAGGNFNSFARLDGVCPGIIAHSLTNARPSRWSC